MNGYVRSKFKHPLCGIKNIYKALNAAKVSPNLKRISLFSCSFFLQQQTLLKPAVFEIHDLIRTFFPLISCEQLNLTSCRK